MAKLTRRRLIKQTSVGAAALGALMAAPGLASAQIATAEQASAAGEAMRKPVVAYVRDHAKGEVAVLVDTREIIVHDHELVRRLMQAAR